MRNWEHQVTGRSLSASELGHTLTERYCPPIGLSFRRSISRFLVDYAALVRLVV